MIKTAIRFHSSVQEFTDCTNLDTCPTVRTILDKDLTDFQYQDIIRRICGGCSEFERRPPTGMTVIVFDRRGFPYVYEMKIDELLIVCQTSPMECRGESISEYIDFPEGKVVVLGIVNSEIPNKEIDEQPDLEYLAKLESALEKGNWYPLQLSKQRIQVWSLSY